MSGSGDQPRIVSIDLTHLVVAALAEGGAEPASGASEQARGGDSPSSPRS